jgi:hypothetical protein
MDTARKGAFNINSTEGSSAAEEYRTKLYNLLMSKTPKERYEFLSARGWTRIDKENVVYDPEQRVMNDTEGMPHLMPVGKREEFVRVTWQMPEDRGEGLSGRYRHMNQTKALLTQLWWNMEEAGLLVRGRISW